MNFLSFYITQNLVVLQFFTRIMVKPGYLCFLGIITFQLSFYSEIKVKKDDYYGEYN